MTRAIGEIRRAGNPGQFDDAGPRGLPEQQHDRDPGAQQHTIDGARTKHAEQGHDGGEELASTELPDVTERANVDEAHHRREHDRRQHRLRQVAQQSGRKEHDDQREDGGDETGYRCSCPCTFIDE